MGVKETHGGPGTNSKQKVVSKSREGMFKRDIKVPKVNQNPGPAHYFQNGIFDADKFMLGDRSNILDDGVERKIERMDVMDADD